MVALLPFPSRLELAAASLPLAYTRERQHEHVHTFVCTHAREQARRRKHPSQ
jgi:hypothetical protein